MHRQAQQLLHYIQAIEQDKLAQWSGVGLLVLASYSAAVTTWETVSLLRGPVESPLVVAIPQQKSRQTLHQPPSAGGLFGTAGNGESGTRTSAPDTNLNLSLSGVIAADDPAIALAFIRVAGGAEKSYFINEQVSGGAIVKEIYQDRVILSRNGRFETLRMPQKFSGIVLEDETSQKPLSGKQSNIIQPAVSTEEIQKYKQKLLSAPNELAGLIRQRPVRRNGKVAGYRLFPGSDRELFNRLGLKPGDIITAVNDLPLNDPTSAMALYGQLPSMSQLNIKLERGGQPMDLALPW